MTKLEVAVYVINNGHLYEGFKLQLANKYHSIDEDCVMEHSFLASNQTFCYSKHQIKCFNHMQYCSSNTTFSCCAKFQDKISSRTLLSILFINDLAVKRLF